MSSWITRTLGQQSSVTFIYLRDVPTLCGLKGKYTKIGLDSLEAASERGAFWVLLTYFDPQAITVTPLHRTLGARSRRCPGECGPPSAFRSGVGELGH